MKIWNNRLLLLPGQEYMLVLMLSVLSLLLLILFMDSISLSSLRNIGLPDSLLSCFDLCFVVLDEHNTNKDRLINTRVIYNHTFTIDAPNVLNEGDAQVIEPEIYIEKGKKKLKCMKNTIINHY